MGKTRSTWTKQDQKEAERAEEANRADERRDLRLCKTTIKKEERS